MGDVRLPTTMTDPVTSALVHWNSATEQFDFVPAASSAATFAATNASLTTTLIPAVAYDRTVIVTATVVTATANGDGAQPTFSAGQTGSVAKFIATSAFTTKAAGTNVSAGGTLSANTALLITSVVGTGTTETGAVTFTAVAL